MVLSAEKPTVEAYGSADQTMKKHMKKLILVSLILLESINDKSINCLLIQLVPSINYSIQKEVLAVVPCATKFKEFPKMFPGSPYVIT